MNKDLNFDKQHIWHPYTSTSNPLKNYLVKSAKKSKLKIDNNKFLIDGMSSWWSTIHGYNNKKINKSIKKQLKNVSHVMFGGITHDPAIELCKKLNKLTSSNLDTHFLCCSGSVSVEVALKMALQFWHSQNKIRPKFLTIKNSYHGDTFAAMSITDPDNSMHSIYKGFLPEHIFAEPPKSQFNGSWDKKDIGSISKLLDENKEDIAAIILEPIVQGAGAMRFYHKNFLTEVRKLCDKYNILLILDEIATGFGRTGKLFAYEHAKIQPDILCVGKALTGGYMSLAATITSKKIADTICNGPSQCFMHGPTFMGNPLACAAANASLDIIMTNKWQKQVQNIEHIFSNTFPNFLKYELVKDIRVLGAIGVIELHHNINIESFQKFCVKQGVWIRPFKNLIYLMPPFIISNKELLKLLKTIDNYLKRLR